MCKPLHPARRALWPASTELFLIILTGFLLSGSRAVAAGRVHGAVFTTIDEVRVYLPSAQVYLTPTSGPPSTAPVTTDLDGSFVIPPQPSGDYVVCVEAVGFQTYCDPGSPLTITDQTAWLPPIELQPLPQVFAGLVTLADSSPSHFRSTVFGLDLKTTVALMDSLGATAAGPVLANELGEYVIAGAPALGSGSVRADFAGLQASTPVMGPSDVHADILLPNSRPIVRTLSASVGGTAVRKVAPGTTVQVTADATDPDGNALHYSWSPSAFGGTFSTADAPSVPWTLPSSPGIYYMEAVVDDGRSRIQRTLGLTAGAPGAMFTGTVTSESGTPLIDATVILNGSITKTIGGGFFSIRVPESPRYVLSISKFGYALRSEILNDEVHDQKHRLRPTVMFPGLDPGSAIDTGPAGASISIPPNSLVDQNGVPATGPVNIAVATIDPSSLDGQFPGDWTARDQSGNIVRLISHGAVDIQIGDDAGNVYNLKSGAQATLRLAPSNSNLTPPASLPLWYYDSVAGLWKEEGTASLSAGVYVASLSHLSVINLDLKFSDAACMRVLVDPATLAGKSPKLRIEILDGPDVGRVFIKTLSDETSALVRLPPNSDIRLTVLDNDANPLSLFSKTVNSGSATAAGLDLNLPYPYTGCSSEADLRSAPGTANGAFLTKRSPNGIDPATADAEALAYYEAIDPLHTKTTFASWKTANGFDNTSAVTTVAYYNAGDLGFGRLMAMAQSGTDIAYYVTNFKDVTSAATSTGPIATVAMEYSPHPVQGGNPYTKFYVFNAAGNRVQKANLDGLGDRFIPGLCLNCHSGADYSSTSADARIQIGDLYDAAFLPFDLSSFDYYGVAPWRRSDQEASFRKLNRTILDTNLSPATQELINGWYPTPSSPSNDTYVPPGWSGNSSLYLDVVAKYCRTCHVSRGGHPDRSLDWRAYTNGSNGFSDYVGVIRYAVCHGRYMPHALVTYSSFWFDPAALTALSSLPNWGSGSCPSGPVFLSRPKQVLTGAARSGSEARISRAFPNPAATTSAVLIRLPDPDSEGRRDYAVRAEVFDISGRLIRVVFDGRLPAGNQRIVWDGRGMSGTRVAGGIYHLRVKVDGRTAGVTRVAQLK